MNVKTIQQLVNTEDLTGWAWRAREEFRADGQTEGQTVVFAPSSLLK